MSKHIRFDAEIDSYVEFAPRPIVSRRAIVPQRFTAMQISPLPRATIQDNDRGVWTRERGRLAGHVAPTLITLRLRGNFVPAGIRELRNRGTVLTLETQKQAAVVSPFLLSNSRPRSIPGDSVAMIEISSIWNKMWKCVDEKDSLKSLLMKALVSEKSRLDLGGITTYKLARLTVQFVPS